MFHLLTEIKVGIHIVANLLKVDSTSLRLKQYEHLDECREFDRCLTGKNFERSVASLHSFDGRLGITHL